MPSKFKNNELITFIESSEDNYVQGDKGRIVSIVEFPNPKDNSIIEYFYDVSTSGRTIKNVPEEDIEHALSSTEKLVDDILSDKEKDKQYKDSDIRVGGSRKEKAAYADLISGKDLEALEKDPVLAKELVKKAKVYPELIIANEIDKGVTGGAAFLKFTLRRLCGTHPPNNANKRKFYVEFIAFVVSKLNDVLTIEEFKKVSREIYNSVLEKLILITRPDLEDQIKKEVDEMTELGDRVKAQTDEMTDINTELWNKTKDYYWYRNDVSLEKLRKDKEDFQKAQKYLTWKKDKETYNRYLNNNVTPSVAKILEELGYTSQYKLSWNILEEIFGKKWANFLQNEGADYLEEAKGYDAISKEEANKKTEEEIKWPQERLQKIEKFLEWYSNIENLTYKQKKADAEKFYEEGGLFSWGFYKTNFNVNRPKYLHFSDVKDKPDFLDIYLQKIFEEHTDRDTKEKLLDQIREIKEKYKPRDNDYSWAESGKKGKHGERTDLVANSGIPLSYIKRYGGVAIYDEDLDSDANIKNFFKEKLGITRFEYGNYLPDKERLQHARHFSGALLDMAQMLNWDVKEMVELGDLGIKFASSGRGKAAAHYEPDRIAINLTRSAGDGTISHEMAHYIDHMLAKKFPKDNVTYGRFGTADGSYIPQFGGGQNISDKAIYEAIYNVMIFIRSGTINLKGENAKEIDKLKELHKEYLSGRKMTVTIDASKSRPYSTYNFPHTIEEWIKDKGPASDFFNYNNLAKGKRGNRSYLAAVVNYYKLSSYDFEFYIPTNGTAYYSYSSEMDSPYWSYAWELFARAFECYMFDKLAKLNRSNNYLVSGGYFTRGESIYPQGAEREILFVLFEQLILAIKKSLNISDFKPFRPETADEYVAINLKTEKEKESINVDNADKEVIGSSSEQVEEQEVTIEMKLKKLYNVLLSNKKYEKGGEISTFDKILEVM